MLVNQDSDQAQAKFHKLSQTKALLASSSQQLLEKNTGILNTK